jgi:hypothetical protein
VLDTFGDLSKLGNGLALQFMMGVGHTSSLSMSSQRVHFPFSIFYFLFAIIGHFSFASEPRE